MKNWMLLNANWMKIERLMILPQKRFPTRMYFIKPKGFPSRMYFLQISRERTRARSKIWYVWYEFLVVFSRLYFLVSFTSLRRAVSSNIDLDDTGDKYVGSFLWGTSSFRWEFGVPDVRISFKAVHGFICPTKYRCSFVADIRTRVSAHSQIAWLARITLARLFVRTTNGYKILRASVGPTTHRDRPPSHPAEMAAAENAVEKHELRQVTRWRPLFTASSAKPGIWRYMQHQMRKTVEKLNIGGNKNVHPILRRDCDFLKNENILSRILERERFVIYDKYWMRSEWDGDFWKLTLLTG